VIGTVVALLLLWLQDRTGFITLDESAYFVDKAAVKIIPWQIFAIVTGTIASSFLMLLIPSWLVKKISPVQSIRFT
jgi:lipoprotein-releasing system permease protein